MIDVQVRDGAARVAKVSMAQRTLETPAQFYLTDHLPAGAQWHPQIALGTGPSTSIVATTRFTDVATQSGDQILLRRSLSATASMQGEAVRLGQLGADVAVWGDAFDLAKDPKHFAPALARARSAAGFQRLLYAPGLGEVHSIALLAYGGIDLFDSVPLIHAAAQGLYLTESGPRVASTLTQAQCACPACHLEPPSTLNVQELEAHNHYAARQEIGAVQNAIRQGRLRELVEARCRAHPESVALLRRFDQLFEHFEQRTPVERKGKIWATTKESLQRPECRRFRERIVSRYRPPTSAAVLLLLPCSHRKPYSTSRTHRAFSDALWAAGAAGLVHEVILTSPLGMVPRELELVYPAAHYDVPVTGDWDPEEGEMIRALLGTLLAKRTYKAVISHLPKHTYGIVRDLLPAETIVTCEGENATQPEALKRLELALRQLATQHKRARLETLQHERLRALSDYQFGPEVTDQLFEGTHTIGKWPTGKVLDSQGRQLAMLPTERGLLSLTLEGAQRLLKTGAHAVRIGEYPVKGSIFAVGVEGADPKIRPGDEVVLHTNGILKGIGVAKMSGVEMMQLRRGEAVVVRHHA